MLTTMTQSDIEPSAGSDDPKPVPVPVRHADGEPELLTTPTFVYRLIVGSLAVLYRLFFRLRLRGLEHLPREGRALIVANHASYLDIPLVAIAARPRHVSFMARESLANSRFLAWVMRSCGAVLVARGRGDRPALRRSAAHLEAEDLVAIFAEGTRTQDGTLGAFRKGATLAARMGRAPLVPCALRGTYFALPRGRRLPRPCLLEVQFFPAIDSADEHALERAHELIAAALARPAGEAAR